MRVDLSDGWVRRRCYHLPMSIQPNFGSAARKHFKDAELLRGHSRIANSDHLSGLAAECALKQLVQSVFNGSMNDSGLMVNPETNKGMRSHADKAWDEVILLAQSRNSSLAIPVTNPFFDWHVSGRYGGEDSVGEDVEKRHFEGAREAIKALENAQLDWMF